MLPHPKPQNSQRSQNRWRIVVLATLLLAVSFGIFQVFRAPSEPYYLGRPLRYWILHHDNPVTMEGWRGDEAVQALGANAIPTLVKMLHEDDSRLQIKWHELLANQHLVKDDWYPASYRREAAAAALTSQMPKRTYFEGMTVLYLTRGLTDPQSDAETRTFALAALKVMKPESKQAVHMLEEALTCMDPVLRTNATNALLELDPVAAAKAGCKKL